jgi:hypothetical protein
MDATGGSYNPYKPGGCCDPEKPRASAAFSQHPRWLFRIRLPICVVGLQGPSLCPHCCHEHNFCQLESRCAARLRGDRGLRRLCNSSHRSDGGRVFQRHHDLCSPAGLPDSRPSPQAATACGARVGADLSTRCRSSGRPRHCAGSWSAPLCSRSPGRDSGGASTNRGHPNDSCYLPIPARANSAPTEGGAVFRSWAS